jgi:hypothetical protein
MLSAKKIVIWTTEVEDQPGSTTGIFRALADAGVNLQFALARRQPDKPGTGILFVSPIRGDKQEEAARRANLVPRSDVVGVQVDADDKPGLGHTLTQALASAGLNMRALVAHAIGKKCVVVFAFDNDADADKGLEVLRRLK